MTRRENEALAAAFKAAKADIRSKENAESVYDMIDGVNYAAEHVADAIKSTWPGFDRERFLRAAGVTQ